MNGIFVLAELRGAVADRVRAIQLEYDPKLAAEGVPHVTLIGSSGVGPVRLGTEPDDVRRAVDAAAVATPPLTLQFGPPQRFMQTDIVSLPLDPHGPLRALHERIRASGLPFERSRFPFSPHCTLSFYPTLTADAARALLGLRVAESLVVDRLMVYRTIDPQPSQLLCEVALGASPV